ncbi:MAG: hypothetical protein LBL07_10380 [Tannerella sp.]|jgi:hypothetical protein|nr:hypothetical protein [Tannerella sp.]
MTEKAEILGRRFAYPYSVTENEFPIAYSQEGLTKREYFSGLAMQGLLSAPHIAE